jgi:hypothetical protein
LKITRWNSLKIKVLSQDVHHLVGRFLIAKIVLTKWKIHKDF